MGIKIAKHGNRSVSSLCGSSDLLTELGLEINKKPGENENEFNATGFTFLFAPQWHPSMKFAANVRKELGIRTVFNMLGPLANPFHPAFQIVGVYSADIMEKMVTVLIKLGIRKAVVCHSLDGLDEFSIFDKTEYLYYDGVKTHKLVFDPKNLNLPAMDREQFFCKNREQAVLLAKKVLAGEEISGLYGVALNSGVALFVAGAAETIESGFRMAFKHLKTGAVNEYLNKNFSK